ncbi:DUF4369 domain-containing protein [Myroides odoratus]|uniref:DUF4369 domain-containing protein n=1 Tax=Myroides odoratus TaxID=256 RepID=UPI0039B0B060
MKTFNYWLGLSVIILFASCNLSSNNFVVEGTLANMPDNTLVYLNKIADTNAEELIKLDSTFVKNNTFKFEGKVAHPTLGYLSFRDQKGKIPLFIESGKTQVSIDQDNFTAFDLKGTSNNETLSEFERSLSLYKYNILMYQGQQQQAYAEALEKKDDATIKLILGKYKGLQDDQSTFIGNYLDQYSTSLTALYYLFYTSKDDLSQLKQVFDNLSEKDKQSNLAQLVALKIKNNE